MIGIDTNILVRYLTEDDKAQSEISAKLIAEHSGKEASIFINNIVLCELIWVLEFGYKYSKPQIIMLLKEMLGTIEFAFEDHEMLWQVVMEYEIVSADFSDILIGKLNVKGGCLWTATFDKKAAKIDRFKILK
jgi:predicted nucleic-acid-binding protein